jgi:hypothetical protein
MQQPPILKRQINVSRFQTYREIVAERFPDMLMNEQILFEWEIDMNDNINTTNSDIKYYRLGYMERTNEGIVWKTRYEYGSIEDIKQTFLGSVV